MPRRSATRAVRALAAVDWLGAPSRAMSTASGQRVSATDCAETRSADARAYSEAAAATRDVSTPRRFVSSIFDSTSASAARRAFAATLQADKVARACAMAVAWSRGDGMDATRTAV
jgi:hypothetical protein